MCTKLQDAWKEEATNFSASMLNFGAVYRIRNIFDSEDPKTELEV